MPSYATDSHTTHRLLGGFQGATAFKKDVRYGFHGKGREDAAQKCKDGHTFLHEFVQILFLKLKPICMHMQTLSKIQALATKFSLILYTLSHLTQNSHIVHIYTTQSRLYYLGNTIFEGLVFHDEIST